MANTVPSLAGLEARLGLEPDTLEGPERARAEAALADATALVLAEVPAATADRWSEAGMPHAAAVVVFKAARREFENPQGLQSENLGEHGFSVATATGVYLTEDERATVRRAATGRPAGRFVGSVRTPSAYEWGPP